MIISTVELLLLKKGWREINCTLANVSVSASVSRDLGYSTQFSLQTDVLFHFLDPSADTSKTSTIADSYTIIPECKLDL